MGIEIERKFLVIGDIGDQLPDQANSCAKAIWGICGELASVRIRCAAEKAFLTIKGERQGLVRSEFEYVIPLNEGEQMLQNLCPNLPIEKFRHIVPFAGLRWEVDVFLGKLDGLVLVQVE